MDFESISLTARTQCQWLDTQLAVDPGQLEPPWSVQDRKRQETNRRRAEGHAASKFAQNDICSNLIDIRTVLPVEGHLAIRCSVPCRQHRCGRLKEQRKTKHSLDCTDLHGQWQVSGMSRPDKMCSLTDCAEMLANRRKSTPPPGIEPGSSA